MTSPAEQPGFARAIDEFIDVHRRLSDRPEIRVRLGSFFVMLGRYPEAEAELRAAIRLSPYQPAGYVNLADLFRLQGREAPARETLAVGLARIPGDPALHHSFGLALVRAGDLDAALGELGEARDLAPEQPLYAYTYAVALRTAGQNERAIDILGAALAEHPGDRDLLFALATFHRDYGRTALALRYAERLAALRPDDAAAQGLIRSLRSRGE
jgi:tetratricopeptide (TPR) repeat protein